MSQPQRRRLPAERDSTTRKFRIGDVKGYVTVSTFEDGTPGEVFITIDKAGSTLRGFCDSFAIAVSMLLQSGVPLEAIAKKFLHTRFAPSGFTGEGEDGITSASSVPDYVFQFLMKKFPPKVAEEATAAAVAPSPAPTHQAEIDAPTCHGCGTMMVRSGACHKCPNCGETSGCS